MYMYPFFKVNIMIIYANTVIKKEKGWGRYSHSSVQMLNMVSKNPNKELCAGCELSLLRKPCRVSSLMVQPATCAAFGLREKILFPQLLWTVLCGAGLRDLHWSGLPGALVPPSTWSKDLLPAALPPPLCGLGPGVGPQLAGQPPDRLLSGSPVTLESQLSRLCWGQAYLHQGARGCLFC